MMRNLSKVSILLGLISCFIWPQRLVAAEEKITNSSGTENCQSQLEMLRTEDKAIEDQKVKQGFPPETIEGIISTRRRYENYCRLLSECSPIQRDNKKLEALTFQLCLQDKEDHEEESQEADKNMKEYEDDDNREPF
jgi:hypothetical protein